MESGNTYRKCVACKNCQPMFPKPVERSPKTGRYTAPPGEKHTCEKDSHQHVRSISDEASKAESSNKAAAPALGQSDLAGIETDDAATECTSTASRSPSPTSSEIEEKLKAKRFDEGIATATEAIATMTLENEKLAKEVLTAAAELQIAKGLWTRPDARRSSGKVDWLKVALTNQTRSGVAEPGDVELPASAEKAITAAPASAGPAMSSTSTQTEAAYQSAVPAKVMVSSGTQASSASVPISEPVAQKMTASKQTMKATAPPPKQQQQGWQSLWSFDYNKEW